MAARLLPCPGCARHIRISDSLCPFCGEALPLSYQSAGPARLPDKRLSRAAKFAFGAAVAGTMSLAGCGDDGTATDTGTSDTGMADTGSSDTGVSDTGTMDSMMDTGGVAPPYGIPPDTGPDSDAPDGGDDAGDGGDAAPPADSGPVPAYGAPPSE